MGGWSWSRHDQVRETQKPDWSAPRDTVNGSVTLDMVYDLHARLEAVEARLKRFDEKAEFNLKWGVERLLDVDRRLEKLEGGARLDHEVILALCADSSRSDKRLKNVDEHSRLDTEPRLESLEATPRLEVEKLPGGWVAIYVRVEGGRYLLSELSHRAFEKDAA